MKTLQTNFRNFGHYFRNESLIYVLLIIFCLTVYLTLYNVSSQTISNKIRVTNETKSLLQEYDVQTKNESLVNSSMYIQSRLENVSTHVSKQIEENNNLQTILNEDVYGPLKNESLVIIIQVHNRTMYLTHLISSLSESAGIENTLLIFSHDFYDEEINHLIRSIKFCKVLQIFYPYSLQTHPNTFPGDSPNDCPPKLDKKSAIKRKCNNAEHPDGSGRYREAYYTQIKHHWWWKLNKVFDGLNATKYYVGLVLILEEDYYMTPDFIHVLRLMEKASNSGYPNCRIFTLSLNMDVNFARESKKVQITTVFHNMGIAFNRTMWNDIKSCAKTFCTYDDYNWDFTMVVVLNKCLKAKYRTMVSQAPRISHIGECGFHYKENCKSTDKLTEVQKMLKNSARYMFPKTLTVFQGSKSIIDPTPNGGWGDVRDHELCLKMVN